MIDLKSLKVERNDSFDGKVDGTWDEDQYILGFVIEDVKEEDSRKLDHYFDSFTPEELCQLANVTVESVVQDMTNLIGKQVSIDDFSVYSFFDDDCYRLELQCFVEK